MRNLILRLVFFIGYFGIAASSWAALSKGAGAREKLLQDTYGYPWHKDADGAYRRFMAICKGRESLETFLIGSSCVGILGFFTLGAGAFVEVASLLRDSQWNERDKGHARAPWWARFNRIVMPVMSFIAALIALVHLSWGTLILITTDCKREDPFAVSVAAFIVIADGACFNLYCLCTRTRTEQQSTRVPTQAHGPT